jgi:hypothetical protein
VLLSVVGSPPEFKLLLKHNPIYFSGNRRESLRLRGNRLTEARKYLHPAFHVKVGNLGILFE